MSDNKWCAMCGKWGDHSSGSCPELHPSAPAPAEPAGPSPVVGSGGVVGLPALSSNQIDILKHTSRTGRYVSDEEPDLITLAQRGLLKDHGAWSLAGGMHYYTLSAEGRAALRAHRLAARPIPRQPEPNK